MIIYYIDWRSALFIADDIADTSALRPPLYSEALMPIALALAAPHRVSLLASHRHRGHDCQCSVIAQYFAYIAAIAQISPLLR